VLYICSAEQIGRQEADSRDSCLHQWTV